MTREQLIRFYFPRWHSCAKANDWRMVGGRLLATRRKSDAATLAGQLHQAVWTAAEQIALQGHRAVTAEDLRHACTVAALGRYKSSKDFDNKEADRVTTLFRLLENPDDIDAMMDWNDPERSARRRVMWSIEHAAPEGYVRRIAEDRFGTSRWEDLEIHQLRQLAVTLKQRKRKWQGKAAKTVPKDMQPF